MTFDMIRGMAVALVLVLCPAGMLAGTIIPPLTYVHPDQPWASRRPVTEQDRAMIASYRSGKFPAVYETAFSDQAALERDWAFKSDDIAGYASCRKPGNVSATTTGLRLSTEISGSCRARWSTGSLVSKRKFSYGFFEATIRVADISGLNNAFWLVNDQKYEIDIAEVHYPDKIHMSIHDWSVKPEVSVGSVARYSESLALADHAFGVLWTETDLVYELDGDPVAAFRTGGRITAPMDIRFSTVLADFAGQVPENPVGHDMVVRSLRVYGMP